MRMMDAAGADMSICPNLAVYSFWIIAVSRAMIRAKLGTTFLMTLRNPRKYVMSVPLQGGRIFCTAAHVCTPASLFPGRMTCRK